MKNLRSQIFGATFLAGALAVSWASLSHAQSTGECPQAKLNGTAEMHPPDADVPPVMARWLGLYGQSRWNDVLCHSIAVIRINKDGTARVQYSNGNSSSPALPAAAGSRMYDAQIQGDKLSFEISAIHAAITYTLSADGKQVEGLWISPNYRLTTALNKVPGDIPPGPGVAAR